MSRRASIILFIVAISLLLYAALAQTEELKDSAMSKNASLAGSHWWVEDILGKGVVDRSHSTISFAADGSVFGDSSCNRYTGSYEANGEKLKFGVLAGTRRACVDVLMNQEQSLYQAMDQVTAWRIGEDTGLLYLLNSEGETVIRAFATEPED